MAKKKTNKHDLGDMDFDDLDDLGDLGEDSLDLGDELGVDEENREPSRAKMVTELAKEAGKGALESTIKNTAKKTLPDEYSSNYYEAMDVANFTKDVFDRNKQVLNKSMYKLGKEVSKVLPFKIGMLEDYIEKQEGDFETQKTQSEDEMRNASTQSELTNLFDKQLEIQKAIEAKHDAEADVDKREKLIQNKMSQDVLTNIDSNIAQQTAFTIQIGKEYYRRSLELQIKSLYVQSDMLRTMRDHYKAFAVQFTNIEKNTSLPDFVKLKNTEKLKDIMREQTVQTVYRQIFSNSKYMEAVKKRMGGLVDEKIRDVTDVMDSVTDMLDNITSSSESMGTSAGGLLATVGAGMAGDTLGEKIADKISPTFRDRLKNNKVIKTGANYLGMLGNSPSTLMESLKDKMKKMNEENQDESSPTRWLKSKLSAGAGTLLDVGTPGAENFELKQEGYLGHERPAIFDNKVHRSITEIMPMYLAAILKQNTDLTSMYKVVNPQAASAATASILSYDYKNRNLNTTDEIRKNIEQDVFKNKSVGSKTKRVSEGILSETARKVEGSASLSKMQKASIKKHLSSKESSKLFSKYIEDASKIEGQNLSYDELVTDFEGNVKLKDLAEKDPRLQKLLKSMTEHKVEKSEFIDSRLKDVKREYPIEPVKRAFLEISRIAGNKTLHVLKDDVADEFAKCFVKYIIATGKDVVSASIIDKTVFKDRIKDTRPVRQSISLLIYDCKKVELSGEEDKLSAVNALLAIMNASLKGVIENAPEVFSELDRLMPNLLGKGKLGVDQLVGGKIGVVSEDEETKGMIDTATLISLGKRKAIKVKNVRELQNKESLLDSFVTKGSAKLKEVGSFIIDNKKDPGKVVDYLKKELLQAKTSVSAKLKSNADVITAKGEELRKQLDGYKVGAEKAVVTTSIKVIDEAIEGCDKQISMLETDLRERVQNVSSTAELAANSGAATTVTKETGKLTKTMTKQKEEAVKLLQAAKKTLISQREVLSQELSNIESGKGSSVSTFASNVRNKFRDTITSLETAVREYNQATQQPTP